MKKMTNDRAKHLKALFYGLGGSGKSTLAYSAIDAPECLPVLAINFAGNPPRVFDHEGLYGIEIENPVELGKLVEAVMNGTITKLMDIPIPKCIIIDTLTQVNRSIMAALTNDRLSALPTFNKDQMQHYGQTLSYLLGMTFPLLSRFEGHVIITAQQKVSEFSPDNLPSLIGQAISEIPAYASLVGQIKAFSSFTTQEQDALLKTYNPKLIPKTEVYSVLTLKPSVNLQILKNQYDRRIPNVILNPTISDLLIKD